TAAGTRGHLDVLDQPREQLASFGVQRGLLVLGRRPLGVSGHFSSSLPYARAADTMPTNSSCTRRSPVISGWKAVASTAFCRTATILPAAGPAAGVSGTVASTSTSAPTDSTHGARMKTACSGSANPAKSRSA